MLRAGERTRLLASRGCKQRPTVARPHFVSALAGAAVAAPLLQVAPAAAKEQLIPVASLTIIQRKQILAELEVGAAALPPLPPPPAVAATGDAAPPIAAGACSSRCPAVSFLSSPQPCADELSKVLWAPLAPLVFPARRQASAPCHDLSLLQKRADDELSKVLTAADAPAAMRLLLADAGSYDAATKTGGCDGSIVLP